MKLSACLFFGAFYSFFSSSLLSGLVLLLPIEDFSLILRGFFRVHHRVQILLSFRTVDPFSFRIEFFTRGCEEARVRNGAIFLVDLMLHGKKRGLVNLGA